VILFFHGKGAAGTDSSRLVGESLPKMVKGGFIPQAIDPVTGRLEKFIVIAPQDPSWSPGPDEVNYIVAWLIKNAKLNIDTNRVYATGLSAGGGRSLMYAVYDSLAVKKIAAVIAMSPAADPDPYMKNFRHLVRDQVPVWFYAGSQTGDGDKRANAERYIKEFQRAKDSIANLRLLPVISNYWLQLFNGGHCCWDPIFKGDIRTTWSGKQLNMYEWFLLWSKSSVPIVEPPTTDPPSSGTDVICIDGFNKIKRMVVLYRDGSFKEYDSTVLKSLIPK